ncbi:MAG: segregation and condensation protein A [Solirubrobacteraceae bacterium]
MMFGAPNAVAIPARRRRPLRLVDLELDLEVFAGPFDLLLTLILREEVDLLEVDLADVVISYVDHLESCGELDLEAATEFLILITALLELKSRLMLPGEQLQELEIDPAEAESELIQRLLDAHRYRAAAEHLRSLLSAQEGYRFRCAPLPAQLRKASLPGAEAVYAPHRLARAISELLMAPAELDLRHIVAPRVTVAERLDALRKLLAQGSFNFDAAVTGVDRMTVAVTLYAVLELYKQGDLVWIQDEPFGEIRIEATRQPDARALGVSEAQRPALRRIA